MTQQAQAFAKEFIQVLSKAELQLAKNHQFTLMCKIRKLIELEQIELAVQLLASHQQTQNLAPLLKAWWSMRTSHENWQYFVKSDDWQSFKAQGQNYSLISPLFAETLSNVTDFNELFYLFGSLNGVNFEDAFMSQMQAQINQAQTNQAQTNQAQINQAQINQAQIALADSQDEFYSRNDWVALDVPIIENQIQEKAPAHVPLSVSQIQFEHQAQAPISPPVEETGYSPIDELHQDGNFGGVQSKKQHVETELSQNWLNLPSQKPTSTRGKDSIWKYLSLVLLGVVLILIAIVFKFVLMR
jgi:hypothetical protein